jgi:hypothetical protein
MYWRKALRHVAINDTLSRIKAPLALFFAAQRKRDTHINRQTNRQKHGWTMKQLTDRLTDRQT